MVPRGRNGGADLRYELARIGGATSAVRRTGVVRVVDFVHRPARILPKIIEMPLGVNKSLLSLLTKAFSSPDFASKRLQKASKDRKVPGNHKKASGLDKN